MRVQILVGSLAAVFLITAGVIYATALLSSPHIHQHADLGAVAGRVLNTEGRPISGAEVCADRSKAPLGRRPCVLTDAKGRFQIKGLAPDTYMVSAAKEAEGYPPTDSIVYAMGLASSPQVEVYGQQTTADVMIFLGPRMTKLTGRVRDTSGTPIGNAQITLCRSDMPDKCNVTGLNKPDDEGAFELLAPPVPFTIEISAPGYRAWNYTSPSVKAAPSGPAPGAIKKLDVLLRRER